jgi:hypothetical protein
MKLYVIAMDTLKTYEKQDETQFVIEIYGFLSSPHLPPWILMYFVCRFSFNLIFMIKLCVMMLFFKFYYTPLMTIFSCKYIVINYGCMFWWFFFTMGNLISLSSKTLWKPLSSKNNLHCFTLTLFCVTI